MLGSLSIHRRLLAGVLLVAMLAGSLVPSVVSSASTSPPLAAPVLLAAPSGLAGEQPTIPSWPDFWAWVATGAFIIPLVAWLKQRAAPVGPFIDQWAFIIVPLLTVFAPIVAGAVTSYMPTVPYWGWVAVYAAFAFAASQIGYNVQKQLSRALARSKTPTVPPTIQPARRL